MQQAVLFDYDDTLVQTRECKYLALKAVAQRYYAVEISSAQIDEHWGGPYQEFFKNLFGAYEPDIARVIQRYEALDAEFAMRAHPETLRTLESMSRSCLIGIVTAAGRKMVERQMAQLGIRSEWLAVLQTAEDTPHHKPDPRVFEPALAKLAQRGIEKERVSYVGDSLQDYRAARDAGLQFWGVLRGTTSPEAFALAGARTVQSLDELPACLMEHPVV